jgi:hypothetical protein
VKAQTSAYLDQAEAIFRMGLNEPAGRTAYLVGFHAAQAVAGVKAGRLEP